MTLHPCGVGENLTIKVLLVCAGRFTNGQGPDTLQTFSGPGEISARFIGKGDMNTARLGKLYIGPGKIIVMATSDGVDGFVTFQGTLIHVIKKHKGDIPIGTHKWWPTKDFEEYDRHIMTRTTENLNYYKNAYMQRRRREDPEYKARLAANGKRYHEKKKAKI